MNAEPAVWFPAIRAGTGADVFTLRLAEGLRKRGIRAEIEWLPHRTEYLPWSVPVPGCPSWANIVHVNTWLPARFIPVGLPVVATIHHAMHDPILSEHKGLLRRIYHESWIRRQEREVMRRSSRVVAVSAYAAELARRYVYDCPVQVIPNGVDVDVFSPSVTHRQGKPFRLLYVGKWSRLKGVEMLAPIMSRLGDNFFLDYTGPADHAAPHMPGNTRDIGRLNGDAAVASAMRNADALIFPSVAEGFGMVVAEAIACGLPVIASNIPALAELVEEDVIGYLSPPADIEGFVSAARRLSNNNELLLKTSKMARKKAIQQFTIDVMVKRYASLYVDCIRA